MRRVRTVTTLFLPLALMTFSLPASGAAQVGMVPDEECRCVDPSGEEIENCRCFRTLDRGQFAWAFSSSRPRIGITLSTSDDENAAQGATIQEVMEDGPADRAGLREGDVITHLKGQSLFDPLQDEDAEADLDLDGSLPAQRLLHLARELEAGDEVEVRYLRDGAPATATVTADELEGWGGNYLFLGEDWENRWDPEAFEGAWDIQEFRGDLKEMMEQFRTQWDTEEFREQWRERAEQFESQWDAEAFEEQWKEKAEQFESQWDTEEFREQWEKMAEQFQEQNWRNFRFRAPGGEGNVVIWSDEDEPKVLLETFRGAEPWSLYFGDVGGLHLENLNPNLGEYFGTDTGVLITDVDEGSTLGLQAGDVVLRVGDREATDPARLRKILLTYEPDEEITLHIMRQKRELTVSGTLGR